MEILYADPYYDTDNDADYSLELVRDAKAFDSDCVVMPTDFGLGADFPGFILEIFKSIDWSTITTGGVIATFFLGEKIEKNFASWQRMGKALIALFKKQKPTYIDENAATLMAISELEEPDELSKIELSVQIIHGQSVPHGYGKLGKSPFAIYIISIVSNGRTTIKIVTSAAKTLFEHQQGLSWMDF